MDVRTDSHPRRGERHGIRALLPIVTARVRITLLAFAVLLIVVDTWVTDIPWWLPLITLLTALLANFVIGRVPMDPVTISPPVSGRWIGFNSPASRVPSHGLHTYGQTYAIDLVHVPDDACQRRTEWWPLSRPADEYPSFGRPVLAPGPGTVIAVHDSERDHRSRTSWPALAYLLVEGAVREMTGPARILGNHVIIALDQGAYALVAHLRRGTIQVHVGESVQTGQQIAMCGNSGNTTEPHVHLQVMDVPQPLVAAGLPMAFDADAWTGSRHDLPANRQPFEATPVRHSSVGPARSAGHAGRA